LKREQFAKNFLSKTVVDLEHGPYKTASDTLASRFVASDNLDVT